MLDRKPGLVFLLRVLVQACRDWMLARSIAREQKRLIAGKEKVAPFTSKDDFLNMVR